MGNRIFKRMHEWMNIILLVMFVITIAMLLYFYVLYDGLKQECFAKCEELCGDQWKSINSNLTIRRDTLNVSIGDIDITP